MNEQIKRNEQIGQTRQFEQDGSGKVGALGCTYEDKQSRLGNIVPSCNNALRD